VHPHELSRKHTGNVLADLIMGGQDGLVNVLGVILGVTAASGDIRIVVAGGLAAAFAESVSMGACVLTAKIAERDHYWSELARERTEIATMPDREKEEICKIYKAQGFEGKVLDDIVRHITQDEKLWLETMMREELELKEIPNKEVYYSGFIVGFSALIGSFVPLTPYFFLPIGSAIYISLAASAVALFLVGVFKARATIGHSTKSGFQMFFIGMGAALVGYLIGKLFGASGV